MPKKDLPLAVTNFVTILGTNCVLAQTVPSADCTVGTNIARKVIFRGGMVIALAKTVPNRILNLRLGLGMVIALAKIVPTFFGTNLARRGMVARIGMDIARARMRPIIGTICDLAKIVPTFFERVGTNLARGARLGQGAGKGRREAVA